MWSQRHCRQALTLIELLIVIAIIAVLVGCLIPAVAMVQSASRRVACASNLRQCGVGFMGFVDDHQGRMPRLKEWVAGQEGWHWHWFEMIAPYVGREGHMAGGNQGRSQIQQGRSVIIGCPGWRATGVTYEIGYGMNYRLALPESEGHSDHFWEPIRATARDFQYAALTHTSSRALLADADWHALNHWGYAGNPPVLYVSDWPKGRHRGAINQLFCDLHVQTLRDPQQGGRSVCFPEQFE